MSAKNGKPCKKCGGNEWYEGGDCAPCSRASSLEWQRLNPEKALERLRRFHRNNPDKDSEYGRRWRKNNRRTAAARQSRHRTKKSAAGGSHTAAEWYALVNHYGNKCLCCGRADAKLTADHVVPVSKGGTSNIDNIQPLCGACNSSKGDKGTDYRPEVGLGRWIQRKLFGQNN